MPGVGSVDVVVTKTRDSAFHDADLQEILSRHDIDRLVLCGVLMESCIAATATDAYARDLRVALVEDATASVDTSQHDQTLRVLHEQYRQPRVAARDVGLRVAELARSTSPCPAQTRPASMSINRPSTRSPLARRPSCSCSLVTHVRTLPTRRAVSSDRPMSTYMSSA